VWMGSRTAGWKPSAIPAKERLKKLSGLHQRMNFRPQRCPRESEDPSNCGIGVMQQEPTKMALPYTRGLHRLGNRCAPMGLHTSRKSFHGRIRYLYVGGCNRGRSRFR